jgi:hypothetical protein
MRSDVFVFMVWVLFLSGCIQTQTYSLKREGASTSATYVLEKQDETILVRLLFPSQEANDEVIKLMTQYDAQAETYRFGVDTSSKYFVADVQETRQGNQRLFVLKLTPDYLKLPRHSPPQTPQFDPEDIYSAMGTLSVGSGKCNGILVAPDLVLTAKHCIDSAQQCGDTTFFIWRANMYQARACERVLFRSPDVDQTLIRLKEPVNSVFQPISVLSRAVHFPTAMPVFVTSDYSIWTKGLTRFSATTVKNMKKNIEPCSIADSFYVSYSKTPNNRDIMRHLTTYSIQCKIVPGQSGSAVVDAAGQLIGILYASSEPEKDQKDYLGYFSPIEGFVLQQMNL